MGAVEDAEDVGLDHPSPLLGGGVLDRAEQHHAGVVDEHVQTAQLGVCALHERPRLGLVAHVSGDRDRAGPPPSVIRWARASIRSARRAASETAAPAWAQASAVASPMPEDAPVTATTLEERSMVIRRA